MAYIQLPCSKQKQLLRICVAPQLIKNLVQDIFAPRICVLNKICLLENSHGVSVIIWGMICRTPFLWICCKFDSDAFYDINISDPELEYSSIRPRKTIRVSVTHFDFRWKQALGLLKKVYENSVGMLLCWLVTWIPGHIGDFLRYAYYRKKLRKMGAGVRISVGVEILSPKFVSIGDRTWIDRNVLIIAGPMREGKRLIRRKANENYDGEEGHLEIGCCCHIAPNCVIQSHGGVSIGDFVGIASGSLVYSATHHYKGSSQSPRKIYRFTPMAPDSDQSLIVAPVVLMDNTAIGLNSVVLPGVTVGRNSWVGVLSFIVKDVPPDSIAIGNPPVVRSKIRG